MAPIRYSLHYEDYSEHLMSRFGKLLQMQSLVDMTLMCNSHTLRVHKAVLAASSAYFQEVLQKQTGEPLIILKMRFCVLKCLVEFMYCGKTQCLEENLDELVSAAQFFKIKGLSKVTKEGLGITSHGEPPVFTPPVVISRPPQSFIGLNSQDNDTKCAPPQQAPTSSTCQAVDSTGRKNKVCALSVISFIITIIFIVPCKGMVVRIPFDIENGSGSSPGADYPEGLRAIKPRRGRPSENDLQRLGWNGTGGLSRAAERALLRREQDSRKAIHQLKHLQNKQMQDYMDRVTLSEAVNSICGPDTSSSHNYMNIDADLMCIDQSVSSNIIDPTIAYTKEATGSEIITSSYSTTPTCSSANDTTDSGITTAMSQYVNALKDAGLPTDLPILFESGDGSYINVNEQVLLDMVQSNEIQYEVIEQPNIIEKVADPNEIKSIDDLSKSIERGKVHLGTRSYNGNYSKETTQFIGDEDTINSLNAILPDNLESFGEQQNYVVLDSRLQEHSNDFSYIDGDMQFFTKSMSDDIKKYYEEQQLNDARVAEQLCPTSTTLDTNFSISLLDSKSSHLNADLNQQYNSLNSDDLRRNEDYDFSLPLPQSTDFKEDALDCLMSTPKQATQENTIYGVDNQFDKSAQEQVDIIKDLMNTDSNDEIMDTDNAAGDFNVHPLNVEEFNMNDSMNTSKMKEDMKIASSDLQWNNIDNNDKNIENYNIDNNYIENIDKSEVLTNAQFQDPVIDLTEIIKEKSDQWEGDLNETEKSNKDLDNTNSNATSNLENDIPYAVGLLPLKQVQPTEGDGLLKRKKSGDTDIIDKTDAKCSKRKVKYKHL